MTLPYCPRHPGNQVILTIDDGKLCLPCELRGIGQLWEEPPEVTEDKRLAALHKRNREQLAKDGWA